MLTYSELILQTSALFPEWLYQFTCPSTVQEGSLLSTPPPVFFIGRLFKDAHSDSVKWYLTVLIVEVELSPSIYLLECPFL